MEKYEDGDSTDVPANPFDQARMLVQNQAKDLSLVLRDLEEDIARVGRELDNLTKAREVVWNALRGTEELRAEFEAQKQADAPLPKVLYRGIV